MHLSSIFVVNKFQARARRCAVGFGVISRACRSGRSKISSKNLQNQTKPNAGLATGVQLRLIEFDHLEWPSGVTWRFPTKSEGVGAGRGAPKSLLKQKKQFRVCGPP